MKKSPGVTRTRLIQPALLVVIAVYVVVAVSVGTANRLGFLVTSAVTLLPILLIVVLAAVGSRHKPTPPNSNKYETTGATTRIKMAAHGDPSSIMAQIKSNLEVNKRFRIVDEAPEALTIRSGVGIFTWGQEIRVVLSAGDSGTVLNAECRHYRQTTAIVDFGQSRRDLEQVLAGIRSED